MIYFGGDTQFHFGERIDGIGNSVARGALGPRTLVRARLLETLVLTHDISWHWAPTQMAETFLRTQHKIRWMPHDQIAVGASVQTHDRGWATQFELFTYF